VDKPDVHLPVGLPVDQQFPQGVVLGTLGQLHQDIGPQQEAMVETGSNNGPSITANMKEFQKSGRRTLPKSQIL
jgi:hypothetical protein